MSFDWSELSGSARWSAVTDLLCCAGVLLVLASGVANGRASLRSAKPAGIAALLARGPLVCLLLAFAAMFTSIWHRGIEVHHFPSQTMSEVLNMFTTALLVSMIVLHFALGLASRGAGWAILDDVLCGLVLGGVFATHAYIRTLSTAQRDLPPALQSYWFPPHLSSLIFSYATMGIAGLIALTWFATRFWCGLFSGDLRKTGMLLLFLILTFVADLAIAGIATWTLGLPFLTSLPMAGIPAALLVYALMRLTPRGAPKVDTEFLIAVSLVLVPFAQLVTLPILLVAGLVFGILKVFDRVPSIPRLVGLEKELDEVSFRAFAVGIPFLTAGVWMGAFWAQEAWANYWGWDSKENTALITWLVYIVYIHLRMLGGYRGSKAMSVLVAGALSVFMTFQIFGYLPDSQKSLHRYTDDAVTPSEGRQGPMPSSDATPDTPGN